MTAKDSSAHQPRASTYPQSLVHGPTYTIYVLTHVSAHNSGTPHTCVGLGGLLPSHLLLLLCRAQVIGHLSVRLGNSYKNNTMSFQASFQAWFHWVSHTTPRFINVGYLGIPGKGLVQFTPIAWGLPVGSPRT